MAKHIGRELKKPFNRAIIGFIFYTPKLLQEKNHRACDIRLIVEINTLICNLNVRLI